MDNASLKIRAMQRVAQAIRTAAQAGAIAYANGTAGEKPIVDRHFTAGNQQRYGWAALTRDYFMAKQRGLAGKVRSGVYYPGGGKTGSRLDKQAGFREVTGELVGLGSGSNAPMLVASGDLRAAVVGPRHAVVVSNDGGIVTIKFANLPQYAIYHHEGGPDLPQRSPVAPNELDRQEVIAVMRRHVDAALGTGGKVPVTGGSVPGKARFV